MIYFKFFLFLFLSQVLAKTFQELVNEKLVLIKKNFYNRELRVRVKAKNMAKVLGSVETQTILANFEGDPDAVIDKQDLFEVLYEILTRDLSKSSTSRAILFKLIDSNLRAESVAKVFRFLIQTDTGLDFLKLLTSVSGMENIAEHFMTREMILELPKALINHGKFDFAKKLFLAEIPFDTPEMFAHRICSSCHQSHVEEAAKFLKYLIVEMKYFGVNDLIMGYNELMERTVLPPLYITNYLRKNPFHQYARARINQVLLEIGADPQVKDSEGRTAQELYHLDP